MTVPDVSVIIPAYNAMPYFTRCLDSLEGQTLGTDRMEIILIDDGSSDGTAAEADRRAAEHPSLYRVEHHPASGGPAGPRNRALDIATGRYVYFLDADDYLGVEALERLVAVADEEGSDVVGGRMVSDNGRAPGGSMFTETDLDADLFTSKAYLSISVLKLYRRSMLEQHQIRFSTRFAVLSDQPFAALAYLRATKISLMADYDYYWVVQREDGQHVTLSGKVSDRLDVAEEMCALLAREVDDPDKRARLLSRHFQVGLRRLVVAVPECEPSEQQDLLDRIGALVKEHLTPALAARLSPLQRLLYHLAGRGLLEPLATAAAFDPLQERPWEVTVSQGRAYAQMPYFRDADLAVPDDVYDVTDQLRLDQHLTGYSWTGATLQIDGQIAWRRVADDVRDTVDVLLRNRDEPETTYVVPARRTGPDTFAAELDTLTLADGSRLPDGIWDVLVAADPRRRQPDPAVQPRRRAERPPGHLPPLAHGGPLDRRLLRDSRGAAPPGRGTAQAFGRPCARWVAALVAGRAPGRRRAARPAPRRTPEPDRATQRRRRGRARALAERRPIRRTHPAGRSGAGQVGDQGPGRKAAAPPGAPGAVHRRPRSPHAAPRDRGQEGATGGGPR